MTKSIFLNHLSILTKPTKARELAEEFNLAVTTARTWAMTNGYVVTGGYIYPKGTGSYPVTSPWYNNTEKTDNNETITR